MPEKGDAVETTEDTGIAAPPARPALARLGQIYDEMRAEAAKVVVGQQDAFQQMLVALFTGGHVLLEGVPGTAKTLMAKTLALLVNAGFDAQHLDAAGVRAVLTPESLAACRAAVREVTVDESVMAYITALATASRRSP